MFFLPIEIGMFLYCVVPIFFCFRGGGQRTSHFADEAMVNLRKKDKKGSARGSNLPRASHSISQFSPLFTGAFIFGVRLATFSGGKWVEIAPLKLGRFPREDPPGIFYQSWTLFPIDHRFHVLFFNSREPTHSK